MSFTSNIFYICLVLYTAIGKGNGALLEIHPDVTVPSDTSNLTLKCMAATGSDITNVMGIEIKKDEILMASIFAPGFPTMAAGFGSSRYTASGEMAESVTSNFLQVDIANPNCSDIADYTCSIAARNDGGTISPNPTDVKTVFVQTHSSDLDFNINPDKTNYILNEPVIITCSGKVGDPALPWTWERKDISGSDWEPYPDLPDISNGTLLPPDAGECSNSQDSVLSKTLKSFDDGVSIRCLLDNVEVGITTFTVYYGPTEATLTPPAIDPVFEGNDMTPVTCSYDACNPPCELKWYKDEVHENNLLTTENGILDLTNVNRSQAGTYICSVSNPEISGSEKTLSLSLEMYYGPDFIHINSSTTVGVIEFEDLVQIPCWTECNPECDIKWYNGSIDDNNLIMSASGELQLFNVSRSQQDTYYCEVSHPSNTSWRLDESIDLQVYYGPEDVQIFPESVNSVAEGSSLEVICSANCNPNCQFTWYFQSLENIIPVDDILSLRHIKRNEAGLYICAVNQPEIINGSQTVEIEIHVHCLSSEISLSVEPSKEEYDIGENVSFTCSGEFSSTTVPSWKWQNSSGDNNDWIDFEEFTIHEPTDDDRCSFQQETTISVTIATDNDGLDIRCIVDGNEAFSQSVTIKVKSNDQGKNGGSTIYGGIKRVLLSLLLVLIVWNCD